mgnify:CR=1 FL=1
MKKSEVVQTGGWINIFPRGIKKGSVIFAEKIEEEYYMAVADSFMLSADNAHAVHPNYQDKTDPTNRPYINEGIVLKIQCITKIYNRCEFSGTRKISV